MVILEKMTSSDSKTITEGLRNFLLLSTIIGILIYCSLPYLVNGFNWLPGDDHIDYVAQIKGIKEFQPQRYYGIFPSLIIPLPIYYYLTPLLVFLGLYISLRNYGILTPIIAWIILFFITSVVLQDMEAGTFIGIIGFYTIGIPSLGYIVKNRNTSWFIIPLAVAFHNVSGLLITLAFTLRCIAFNRYRELWFVAPLGILIVLLLLYTETSIQHIFSIGRFTYTDPMPIVKFLKTYLGISTLAIGGITFMYLYNSWRLGKKFIKDHFVIALGLLAVILPVFIFTSLQLNSDRLAKFLVGILVILISIGLTQGIKYLYPKSPKLISVGTLTSFSLFLYLTVPKQLQYWISLGSIQQT